MLILAAGIARSDEADDQYAVAAGHYAAQRWGMAATEFETFLKSYSRHARAAEAVFFLGEALLQQRQFDAARKRLQEYLDREPKGRFARPALFRLGEASYLSGDYGQSQPQLQQFVQRHADDPLCAYATAYLADMALRRGEADKAVPLFRDALARFSNSSLQDDCRLGLARALQQQGKPEEAERYYLAVAGKPTSAQADSAQFYLGVLQFEQGRYAESLDTLVALEKQWPKSPRRGDARLAQGWALFKLHRYAEAKERFAALADDPALGTEARYWLGLAERAEEKWQSAAKTLSALADAAPKHRLQAAMRYHAGDCLLRIGKWDEALDQFERVLSAKPADESWTDHALAGKIQVMLHRKDHAALDALAGEFVKRFPKSPLRADVDRTTARSLIERKQFDRAAGLLEPLAKADAQPDQQAEDRYLLALVHEGQKRYDESLRLIDLVAQRATGQLKHDAQLTRGTLLVALKRYAEAIAPLTAYLESKPQQAEDALRGSAGLAISLARTGKLDKAKLLFADLVKKHPQAELLRAAAGQLSEAALEGGDPAWAEELFARVADDAASPDQLRALAGLAWSQYKAKRLKEAAATFQQVLGKKPEPALAAEAALARGQILEQLGQTREALGMYQAAIGQGRSTEFYAKAILAGARAHVKLKEHRQAAEQFARFAETAPKATELEAVLYEWSWAEEDAERRDESNRLFQRLRKEYPRGKYWADATYRLAQRALESQKVDPAKKMVGELLAAKPEPAFREHGLALQGQIAVAALDWRQVRESFERLASDFPKSPLVPAARYWIAEALYRQKDFREAANRLEQIAAQGAGKRESWTAMIPLRRAQILGREKKWSAAHRLVANIEKDFPGFELQYEADYLLGRCLGDEADFEGARKAYQKVIKSPQGAKTETAAMAQWFLGETYFHQKDYRAALREFLRLEILYAFPEWQSLALLEGAKCHELLGEWKEAVKLYERLLKEYSTTTAATEAADRVAKARQQVKN